MSQNLPDHCLIAHQLCVPASGGLVKKIDDSLLFHRCALLRGPYPQQPRLRQRDNERRQQHELDHNAGQAVTNDVVAHAATVNVAGAKISALHTPDRILPSSIAVIWLIYRSAYSFFV